MAVYSIRIVIACCSALIATVLLAASIYFAVCPSSITHDVRSEQVPVSLTKSSFVLLDPLGYDSTETKSIEVVASFGYYEAKDTVKFFVGGCVFDYNQTELPSVSKVIQPIGDRRLAYNYHYGDYPLYTAGGNSSTLVYSVSGSKAANHSTCPMEIFLFDSKIKYFRFLNQQNGEPASGFLNRSGCIPVGKGDTPINSTAVFHLHNPASYFVAVQLENDVYIEANISGHIREFTNKKFDPYKDCVLNARRNVCSISLPDESSGQVCVLAEADDYISVNVTSVSKEADFSRSHVRVLAGVCTAASSFGIIICCVIALITLRKVYRRSRLQIDVDDETKPFINS